VYIITGTKKPKCLSLTPSCLQSIVESPDTRRVDKTGLISWDSNKYSVPMVYQSSRVGVSANAGQLFIHDVGSSEHLRNIPLAWKKVRLLKTPIIIEI
jgi:hypothetical protein